MNTEEFQSDPQLDDATAARLRKLAAMPVDTSRLDRLIQAQIPQAGEIRNTRWFRPQRLAIAASVMLIIGLAVLLLVSSGSPVSASTAEMAQLHNDLVAGRVAAVRVDSMPAANAVLARQWAECPKMPNMPCDCVMSCCTHSMNNKKMCCVLLKGDSEPVTMTVANAGDMKLPTSPAVLRNGIEYHVESAGGLHMVITQRDRCWICLTAKLPADQLMELAAGIQF